MILMQRLVSSSSRAIAKTLARRLEALESSQIQTEIDFSDDWQDLDGQSQLEDLAQVGRTGLANEKTEVRHLLELAERCIAEETDAKAEALLGWIYRLQQSEQNPQLKLLVFTEFVPTQQMLAQYLTDRGISVVCLNGSMDLQERKQVQQDFANQIRVLISTDAGGEGLNLQFCHIIVNYDMPWNPMRVEQRIGRVDRIGQPYVVRALNFVLENTAEHRVREVLEDKLQVILDEFGVDKTSDVLDSSASNQVFDSLFMTQVVDPSQLDHELAKALEILRENAQEKRQQDALFGGDIPLQLEDYRQSLNHPLPYWVEQMVCYYLQWQQALGQPAQFVRTAKGGFNLTWPDGSTFNNITFSGKHAQQVSDVQLLTLEEPRIANLCQQLPYWVPTMPIPRVRFPKLAAGATGYWALWSIVLSAGGIQKKRFLPIFVNKEGRYFATASNRIWEAVCQADVDVVSHQPSSDEALALLDTVAKREGEAVFHALNAEYETELARDVAKADFSFAARRRAIERIGLPEVRHYRLRQLDTEQLAWQQQVEQRRQVFPQLYLHLVIEIQG